MKDRNLSFSESVVKNALIEMKGVYWKAGNSSLASIAGAIAADRNVIGSINACVLDAVHKEGIGFDAPTFNWYVKATVDEALGRMRISERTCAADVAKQVERGRAAKVGIAKVESAGDYFTAKYGSGRKRSPKSVARAVRKAAMKTGNRGIDLSALAARVPKF